MSPVSAAALFLGAVGALLFVVRSAQTRYGLHPELSRKLFHIGGGVLALLLPWVFQEVLPVIVLSACSALTVLALQLVPRLRESLGKVTSSVGRVSLGEICFPISVCFLFVAARGDVVLYSIPLLILTFADSAAALIGVRYGFIKYAATESKKSIEGSVAFYLVGFLAAHVPLLLGTQIGRAESLLAGLILAFLLVLLEAVSWSGLDNLFVPVIAFVLLKVLTTRPAEVLLLQLAVIVLATVAALLLGRRTTLNPSGLLGGVLLLYATWMIESWQWVMIPALVFLVYPYLSPSSKWDEFRVHDVHVILSIFSGGLAWLVIGYFTGRDCFYPFTVSFAAHLAIVGVVRQQLSSPGTVKRLRHATLAWAVVLAPYLLVRGWSPDEVLAVLFAFPCTLGAVGLLGFRGAEADRWRRQAVAGALASIPAAFMVFKTW